MKGCLASTLQATCRRQIGVTVGGGPRALGVAPAGHACRPRERCFAVVDGSGLIVSFSQDRAEAAGRVSAGGHVLARDDSHPETTSHSDALLPGHRGYAVIRGEEVVYWSAYHLRALQVAGLSAFVIRIQDAQRRRTRVSSQLLASEQTTKGAQ
jgi:hypothetical protein